MKYNPQIHHRRSIRLRGYDYSQAGAYFITICCQDGICRFGKIEKGEMILNDAGQMIAKQWLALTTRFFNIELHEFIVMPNHFHGVIQINIGATDYVVAPTLSNVGAPLVVAPDAIANDAIAPDNTGQPQHTWQPQGVAPTSKTIGDMMDAFKSITTVEYIRGVKNIGWESFVGKLWQRNYYEHIIRDEQSYLNISNYIINNPATWNDDKFYNS